ncbi:MAG TPA: hypothetical protein VKJ65_10565 [Phycisphaerae bacterium]|nr:hypothetical protein [Phycisphaerae bacterium]
MRMRQVVLAMPMILAGALLAGCSAVNVQPISVDQVNDPSVSGVRFYQSAPYLLVTDNSAPQGPQTLMLNPGGPMRQPAANMPGPMQGGNNNNNQMGPPSFNGPGNGPSAFNGGPPNGPGNGPNAGPHNGGPNNNANPGHGQHRMRGMHGQMGPGGGAQMSGRMLFLRTSQQANQGVFTLQIIYLPDYSHPYVAQINSSGNSIALANGWELLGINASGHLDNPPPITATTRPPAAPAAMAMMSMAGGGGPGRAMFVARGAAMAMGLTPGLYQFVFDSKTGELQGLKRVAFLPVR